MVRALHFRLGIFFLTMRRFYHRYENWECWKNGFFNNISGENKKDHIENVISIFSNTNKTEELMKRVVSEWPYSTEHNLSNISLNRVAWLGQAACCIHSKTPCTITMEAWHLVSKENRDIADSIASKIISEYEFNHNEKEKVCPRLF